MKKIYRAHCIEHGERFTTLFKTSETNKKKILEIGQEQAMGWGGECISVKEWKPKTIQMAKLYDVKENKYIQNTKRVITNFMKKNPNNTRYDYLKTEYWEEIIEETPKDVWDNDLSDEENLKNVVVI